MSSTIEETPESVSNKFIYVNCEFKGEEIESLLIDPPIPIAANHIPSGSMAFVEQQGVNLLYHLDSSVFPTVPCFVESFRFIHDSVSFSVPLDPLLAELEVGKSTVGFIHDRAIFKGEYLLQNPPKMGVPITPRNKQDPYHSCRHRFIKTFENKDPCCVMALWDLSSLHHEPRHLVIHDVEHKRSVIHSQQRIYSVANPILCTQPMEYEAGIFMEFTIGNFSLSEEEDMLSEKHYEMMGDNIGHLVVKEGEGG